VVRRAPTPVAKVETARAVFAASRLAAFVAAIAAKEA